MKARIEEKTEAGKADFGRGAKVQGSRLEGGRRWLARTGQRG